MKAIGNNHESTVSVEFEPPNTTQLVEPKSAFNIIKNSM